MNAAGLGQFLLSHLRGLLGRNGLLQEATVKKLHQRYSSLHEEALGWDLDDSISIKTGSAGTFFYDCGHSAAEGSCVRCPSQC